MERVAGKRICDGIIFALDVDKLAVEVGQFLHPSRLSTGKIFLCVEVEECLVVRVNEKGGAEEVSTPFSKGAYDS